MKFQVLILSIVAVVSFAHEIKIRNNCGYTVWPAVLGNPGKGTPLGGGFQLNAKKSTSFKVSRGWAGRVWGRTDCNSKGHCVTGDCGKLQCNGISGQTPATLAEIQFDGNAGLDFYDVSNVDGFNLPMTFRPISGFKQSTKTQFDCKTAGCSKNLNANCPGDAAVKNGGKTVACRNKNRQFFKQNCPNAYSYDYDDAKSTFTCAQNPESNYEIVFCP